MEREINYIIVSFIAIPGLGFLLSLWFGKKQERILSGIAAFTTGIQFLAVTSFVIYWLIQDMPLINIKEITLFKSKEYEFFIDFYFDRVTAVYLWIGSFVTLLIARYSRYYMHLEDGFKRFFNTILLFFFAYNWTVIAGNFETLFIGWEVLGISSFLLIAFYRERYLPVKNAMKVFSVYRIGDIGILAAMWASHHLWHQNINFIQLTDLETVRHHLSNHGDIGLFIGLSILTAAAAKSAQIPFSYWLPRAMEGPTPSSAIFYGSLSVHFGVFLLLRTFPFWEEQITVRILVALTGLITAFVAFFITRVQANIKSQIAYASITQIGIMFVEVALGWHTLALVHFAGNAFLRTYQLLISPSVVSYMIRDQFYHFEPSPIVASFGWVQKLRNTLYVLSLKEFYMEYFMSNVIFRTFKNLGKYLDFLSTKNVLFFFVPAYILGLVLYIKNDAISPLIQNHLPEFIAFIGLIMVLKSFSERKHPRLGFILVLLSHYCIALAVSFNENYDFNQNLIYLSGVSLAGIVGFICLQYLRKHEPLHSDLQAYYGQIAAYPKLSFLFFLAVLGLMGFPITPSFIGGDLVLSHIRDDQYLLSFFVGLTFVLAGIALIRIFTRLFLGPYCKPTQSNPIKLS
jgi:NADH:ubiquinone oxidoreductase subunit 5 (subunit L)/multisubunit Na+/H+ antiporter MnhA subunit